MKYFISILTATAVAQAITTIAFQATPPADISAAIQVITDDTNAARIVAQSVTAVDQMSDFEPTFSKVADDILDTAQYFASLQPLNNSKTLSLIDSVTTLSKAISDIKYTLLDKKSTLSNIGVGLVVYQIIVAWHDAANDFRTSLINLASDMYKDVVDGVTQEILESLHKLLEAFEEFANGSGSGGASNFLDISATVTPLGASSDGFLDTQATTLNFVSGTSTSHDGPQNTGISESVLAGTSLTQTITTSMVVLNALPSIFLHGSRISTAIESSVTDNNVAAGSAATGRASGSSYTSMIDNNVAAGSAATDRASGSSYTSMTDYGEFLTSTQEPSATRGHVEPEETGSTKPKLTPGDVSTSMTTDVNPNTASAAAWPTIPPVPTDFVILRRAGPMSSKQYFSIRFIPKILIVAIQAVWSISHAGINLMEPFFQMKTTNGANGQITLFADHLSSDLSWRSLVDMLQGQWIPLLSNIISSALFIIIALVDEAFIIRPTAFCHTAISDRQPCEPALYANRTIVYAIQASLGVTLVSLAAIALMNHKRCSGVYSDPSKLASMASLLGHNQLKQSLLRCSAEAHTSETLKHLGDHRYSLGLYTDDQGKERYGIIENPGPDPPSEREMTSLDDGGNNATTLQLLYSSFRKIWFQATTLSLIFTLFGIILAYYLTHSGRFNDLMNSATFAPNFILSALGLLATFGLRSIERRERIFETYRRMAKSPLEAKDCMLISQGGTPYLGILYGLTYKWRFVSLVSLVTILADLMQICLSGIPWQSGDTLVSYELCSYLCLSILALMAIVVVSVVWRGRSDSRLPRSPDRLINILLYLCGSNLLQRQTDIWNDKALHQQYEGRYFQFSNTDGPDGRLRWTINEVKHLETVSDRFTFENRI